MIDTNKLILFNERTNRAFENFEKTNNKEEIKALYYISEININNEKTKEFFKIPVRNLDITFNSDLNTLDYKDYYFSGIPVPKNIKTEIQRNVILSWDIDKFKVKYFDNKKIKYEVEIKKDNEIFSNESYEKIMHLDRQKLNNDCEIKIRTIYDETRLKFKNFLIIHKIFQHLIPFVLFQKGKMIIILVTILF